MFVSGLTEHRPTLSDSLQTDLKTLTSLATLKPFIGHSLKYYEIQKINFRVLLGAITRVYFCFQNFQKFPLSCRKPK